MKKHFWFQKNFKDWLSDAQLSRCRAATRGIWEDAICRMYELRSGSLQGSVEELCRLLRATASEVHTAIEELNSSGTATVRQNSNGSVTLICRRLERYFKERAGNTLRVKRHRGNGACNGGSNADVTPQSKKIEVRSKKTNNSAPNGVEVLPSNLQTTEFKDAWAAWEKHRTEIRKPLKPTMRSEQLKLLSGWGATKAVLSLRKSIQNGWQGIFEPDQKQSTAPPPLIGQKSDAYDRVRQKQIEEERKEYLAKQRKHESEPKPIGGIPI